MILENSERIVGQSLYTDMPVTATKKMEGACDEAIRWICKRQLSSKEDWAIFVNQFRLQRDSDNNGWRGEYWGKMMRGAALLVQYTGDDELYSVLEDTVRDMLTVAEPDGRVSSYRRDKEFGNWDIWSRKYVILSMEYFLDICRDDALKGEIIGFLTAQMDYVMSKIGEGEGKKPINQTAKVVESLNSCSILEPTVRLYRLTGEKRFLDYAKYIIDCGGCSSEDIFKKALTDVPINEYNVVKAYEMMSCFEGLVEYYYATGEEWCKDAALAFGEKVFTQETTVIGGCACWGEYFDRAALRQTRKNPPEETMQETCVTVTWMKLCQKLFLLGGDSKYLDAIETSFHNAYLGALNTEEQQCNRDYTEWYKNLIMTVLPFDSYSPLTPDVRGQAIGGLQMLEDNTHYGCCACIGAVGVGIYSSSMLLKSKNGVIVAFYEKGSYNALTPSGKALSIKVDTDYPYGDGKICFKVSTDDEAPFEIGFRVPVWSENTALTVENESIKVASGINFIGRVWKNASATLVLDMGVRMQKAPVFDKVLVHTMFDWDTLDLRSHYDEQTEADRRYVCLTRGPIVLASTEELTSDITDPVDPVVDTVTLAEVSFARAAFTVSDKNGKTTTLVDYGSAGKNWKKRITAWLPVSREYLSDL